MKNVFAIMTVKSPNETHTTTGTVLGCETDENGLIDKEKVSLIFWERAVELMKIKKEETIILFYYCEETDSRVKKGVEYETKN